jgi:virginiamycin A acetyltransferase
VDPDAFIHPGSRVEGSRLYGRVRVAEHCVLHEVQVSGLVSIGYSTSLWGPDIDIQSKLHRISIGNYCSIARGVSIYDYFHDHEHLTTYFVGRNVLGLPLEEEAASKGPVEIGHDVWIGAYAHVTSGVIIGNGAVIGANSVVTKDVPSFAIVGGVPARILKYRFGDEVRRRIESLGWWNWDHDTVRKNAQLFKAKFR